MGESEAEDWLGAAMAAIGTQRIGLLANACLAAQRTCDHHSRLVPTIMADLDAASARLARIDEITSPIALPPPSPTLSQEQFDEMVTERGRALSVALDRGMIVSNGDGTFRLPDRAA